MDRNRSLALVLATLALGTFAGEAAAIDYGNIDVTQIDVTQAGITLSIPAGQKTAAFGLGAGSTRGDFVVQIGASLADDAAGGILIPSVRQNGRNNFATGDATNVTQYSTSSIALTGGGYFIPVNSANPNDEHNTNVAAMYFPFSEGWQAGHARNSAGTNGGANNLLNASPGLVLGTHFVDLGGGLSRVVLPGVRTTTDGILLVTHGKNEENFALSRPATDGSSFDVYIHGNETDADDPERDPVAFAYVPLGTANATLGRILGPPTTAFAQVSQGSFSIQDTANAGEYRLSIPGQTPTTGTLIVSPEGFDTRANVDNIVTYQASGSSWLIQSRDLPNKTLQNLNADEGAFNFVFMPFASPPTAPGTRPTFSASAVSASTVNVTEFTAGNGAGEMFAQVRQGTSGTFVITSNRGDNQMGLGTTNMSFTDGVLLASVAEFSRDNSGGGGGENSIGVANVNSNGSNYVVTTFTGAPAPVEHNINFATAYFPNAAGFQKAAQVAAASGLASVSFGGSGDTRNSGVLMVTPFSNTGFGATVSSNVGGTGWDVQVRNTDESLVTSTFNYVFLPYGTQNLIAGQVTNSGQLSSRVGDYVLTREPAGDYLLTIPDKTPSDGMLLLNAGSATGADQDNVGFYRPDGNSFRIQFRDLGAAGNLGIQDTNFSFAFIGYDAPVSTPALRSFNGNQAQPVNITVRENDAGNADTSVSVNTRGNDLLTVAAANRGDATPSLNGSGIPLQNGILMPTMRQNGTGATVSAVHNGLTANTFLATNLITGGAETNANLAATYFPFSGGFLGAHVDGAGALLTSSANLPSGSTLNPTGTGLYQYAIAGADSRFDGYLFAVNGGNNAGTVTAAVTTTGEWTLGHYGVGGTLSDGPFSLLLLPTALATNIGPNGGTLYNTNNLVGARIAGDGSTLDGIGSFDLDHIASGQYLLTLLSGDTPDDGMLLLTASGLRDGLPDDTMLSYIDNGGGAFLIQARDLNGTLRDADFVFGFSSFENFLSISASALAAPEPGSIAIWGAVAALGVAFATRRRWRGRRTA